MFELGKTYSITILENGTNEVTINFLIDSIESNLIKSGNLIINTNSFVFISAKLID
ncbi:hypothetical protein ACOL3A_05445 [Aliarcobacter butzleri]